MSCKHFAGQPDGAQAVFKYFSFGPDGQRSGPVEAVLDAASGLCWYPNATCHPDRVPSGENCCELSDYGEEFATRPWVVFLVVPPLLFCYVKLRWRTCKRRFAERGQSVWRDLNAMEQKIAERAADLQPANKFLNLLGLFFFALSMGTSILVILKTNEIAQYRLPVTGRNGMTIAEGILNPMDDIFSFLDDLTMVKIGIAMGSGDDDALRKVFFLGTGGGFACGVLGAGIATVIGLVEPLRVAMLDPFSAVAGCTLAQSDVNATAAFFLLSAWQWPFTFASNAFQGFAIATADFPMFGFVMLTRSLTALILIVTWFDGSGSLEVLGGIRLGTAALGCALWCASTARPGMRRRLGWSSLGPSQVSSSGASDLSPLQSSFADDATRRAAKDGLSAMACELSVEMARTITLFVTAHTMGVAAFYQVSTHFTIQISAGLGMAEAIFLNMKFHGAKMLAAGLHHHFAWFFEYMAFAGVAISLSAFVSTYTSASGLSFVEGRNACVYAAEQDCLLEYGNFFGGHSEASGVTMMRTVFTVAPVVTIRIGYRVCRSALYAMQDFSWMVKISIACFTLFFLPAVALLWRSRSPLVAVLVMTIPNITVFPFFAWRVVSNLRRALETSIPNRNPVVVVQRTTQSPPPTPTTVGSSRISESF